MEREEVATYALKNSKRRKTNCHDCPCIHDKDAWRRNKYLNDDESQCNVSYCTDSIKEDSYDIDVLGELEASSVSDEELSTGRSPGLDVVEETYGLDPQKILNNDMGEEEEVSSRGSTSVSVSEQ